MTDRYVLYLNVLFLLVACIVFLNQKRRRYFTINTQQPACPPHIVERFVGNVNTWTLPIDSCKHVLFCHGNKGNVSHRQRKMLELGNLGYSVTVFDYHGYGKTQGMPSERQCYKDAKAVLARIKAPHVVLYGESLGGAVASRVAADNPGRVKKLVLDSALPAMKRIFTHRYPPLRILSPLFPEFNAERSLKRFTGHVLVMHSRDDEVIPWQVTGKLRQAAHKVIEMRGPHNDPDIPWDDVAHFLNT
jgi:fermentation-respiration switch protein FrsA (DUF1100 family)